MRKLVVFLLVASLIGCSASKLSRRMYYNPPGGKGKVNGYSIRLCLDLKPGKGIFYVPYGMPVNFTWCSYEDVRKDIASFFNLTCYKNRLGIAGTELGKTWEETAEDVFSYYMKPYRTEIYWWPECPQNSLIVRGEIKPRFFRPQQCENWLGSFIIGMVMAPFIPIYPQAFFYRNMYGLDDFENWYQEIFDGEIIYGDQKSKVFASLPSGADIFRFDFADVPKGKTPLFCSIFTGAPLTFCVEDKACKTKACRRKRKFLKILKRKDGNFAKLLASCRPSDDIEKLIEESSKLLEKKKEKFVRLCSQLYFGCIAANVNYIVGLRNAALLTKWYVMKKITGDTDEELEKWIKDEGITSPDNMVAEHSLKLYNYYWGEIEKRCPKVYKYGRVTADEWWDTRMQFYRDHLPDECYLTVKKEHSCWEYWTPEDFAKYPKHEHVEYVRKKKEKKREESGEEFVW
ncbi:hypothetical protein [Desulfurobacterium sp.]|uniref:hypothetical protein n=1 Tax=Desulfurobacterium sp. TaxID=2004706 RepID=UPI0026063590|nr:hypothetical protein [Desulfurobacterium sp.]